MWRELVEIVRPWQWVVLACCPLVVFVVAPWLLGLLYRVDGADVLGRVDKTWRWLAGRAGATRPAE